MRALFYMRPAEGAEPHTSLMCGLCAYVRCVDCGRADQRRRRVYLYAPHVTLLLRIGSGSRAMVYKPHQQNDVDTLKHDDKQ